MNKLQTEGEIKMLHQELSIKNSGMETNKTEESTFNLYKAEAIKFSHSFIRKQPVD